MDRRICGWNVCHTLHLQENLLGSLHYLCLHRCLRFHLHGCFGLRGLLMRLRFRCVWNLSLASVKCFWPIRRLMQWRRHHFRRRNHLHQTLDLIFWLQQQYPRCHVEAHHQDLLLLEGDELYVIYESAHLQVDHNVGVGGTEVLTLSIE